MHFLILRGLQYVTSIKNFSPNAHSFLLGCCQFSFKAARFGLVHNSLPPRQPACYTVSFICGYIEYDACLYRLHYLLHLLSYCLTHSATNYLCDMCLRQLHHLGHLFCPWIFMPSLGIYLSVITLKKHRYYCCCFCLRIKIELQHKNPANVSL